MAELKQVHKEGVAGAPDAAKDQLPIVPKNPLLELLKQLAAIENTQRSDYITSDRLKSELATRIRGGEFTPDAFQDEKVQQCFLIFKEERVRYEIFELLFDLKAIPLTYKICGTPLFHNAIDWYKYDYVGQNLLSLMARHNNLQLAKGDKPSFLAETDAQGNNGLHHLIYKFFTVNFSNTPLPLEEVFGSISKDQLSTLLRQENSSNETPLALMARMFITRNKTLAETLPLIMSLMAHTELQINNIWHILYPTKSEAEFTNEFLTALFDAAFKEYGDKDGPAQRIVKKLLQTEGFTLPAANIYPVNISDYNKQYTTDPLICALARNSRLALDIYEHMKARRLQINYEALVKRLVNETSPYRAVLAQVYADAYTNIYNGAVAKDEFQHLPCKNYALAVLDKLKGDETNCRKVLAALGNELSVDDYETLQRHEFPVEKLGVQPKADKPVFGPTTPVGNKFNWFTSRTTLHRAVVSRSKPQARELLFNTSYFSSPRLYIELTLAILGTLFALALFGYMVSVFATGGASLAAIGIVTAGLTTATKAICALGLTLGLLGSVLGIATTVAEIKTISLVEKAKRDVLQLSADTNPYSPTNPLLGSI